MSKVTRRKEIRIGISETRNRKTKSRKRKLVLQEKCGNNKLVAKLTKPKSEKTQIPSLKKETDGMRQLL